MNTKGEQAFPVQLENWDYIQYHPEPGLTKREYFIVHNYGVIAAAVMRRKKEEGYTDIAALYEAHRLVTQAADIFEEGE